MSTEPSAAQLSALQGGDPTERLALISLARGRDAGSLTRWRETQALALRACGGRRVYRGRVDRALAGGALAFDELLIDEFPSRELCAETLRSGNPHAAELAELVVLAAAPRRVPPLALAFARGLAKLRGRAGQRGNSLDQLTRGNAAASPDAVALLDYLCAAPQLPFAMFNLHQYRELAEYAGPAPAGDASGRAAYARYGRNTLPHVLRRDGGPLWAGRPLGLVVGAPDHALAGDWSEIVLVRYPTRAAMRDMLEDATYQSGMPHRDAGLARAVLLATTSIG